MKRKHSCSWMLAMAIILTSETLASNIDFIGVSGTHWNTASNWVGGTYPATGDIAFLDAVASLDTAAPNSIQGIRVGTQGSGTLHVTFDGSLTATTSTSTGSKVGSGSGNSGSVEQTNGDITVNELEIGGNSSTGTYNLNRGTLQVSRRLQDNSLYLGTDASKTSDGLGTLSITAGSLTTRGEVYLGSTSGGIGIFEIEGSDSAQIGIGSYASLDGAWTQNAGSVLRVRIDRTSQGVTSILIDDPEDDGTGGDVLFENGALLDVDFLANFENGGTFTVMEWDGTLTDNGLQFAPSVDTNIWSFNLDAVTKRLTVTSVGSPYVRQFVHPGTRHKMSDLERMRNMIAAGVEPWASSFTDFSGHGHSQHNYTVQFAANPTNIVDGSNYNNFRNDCMAAYQNALMWVITGDSRHADKAIEIFTTWSGLTKVSQIPLNLGRSSMHLIDAAEIIKHTYDGWDAADIQAFSDMLVYPGYSNTTIPGGDVTFYWGMYNGDPARAGNQGYFAMRALLSMGIFLDNERIYDRVIRLARGATNRADDLAYPTGPPVNGSPTATHEFAIQWGQLSRNTTIADYGYNEVFANYIWETGQNEESSRDQVHGAVGLVNISALCEMAWNQGDDLYGHLDNRPLFGWEYWLRYNLSWDNTYPDQPTPWEPAIETGEYLQRKVRTGRRFSLKINPHIDGDTNAWTRAGANDEPIYEINLGHYRDRMGISGDTIKWLERGHALLVSTQGFEDYGSNAYSMPNWGGMKYRRVSPGDPIQGFTNSAPDFALKSVPGTIEAENYDYFALYGEGRTYHDLSTGNSSGQYRLNDGVDIKTCSEGGYALTSLEDGEWLTYTIAVPSARLYDISVRYAASAPGGKIKFSIGNVDQTGVVNIPFGAPDSTGLTDWQDLTLATGVFLTNGVYNLRIDISGTSSVFELNRFSIVNNDAICAAHWRFDDGTGTTALDSSGFNHHGTVSSATWVPGQLQGALDFNGSSSQVEIPKEAFDSITNEISIAMWVYGGAAQPQNDSIFYAEDYLNTRILNIHLPWSNSQVYWDAGNGGGYDRLTDVAPADTFKDRWNHWVFTKNAVSGMMNIYTNGQPFLSSSGNNQVMLGVDEAFIGSQPSGAYYDGMIGDVKVFNVSLSDFEVSTLYDQNQSLHAPVFTSDVVVTNGNLNASFYGTLGEHYVMECTDSLTNTVWQQVDEVDPVTLSPEEVSAPVTNDAGFYRMRWIP